MVDTAQRLAFYKGLNDARQAKIDEYMVAFAAHGHDPANVPMEIPYELWTASTWQLRLHLGPKFKGFRITLDLNNDPDTKFMILPQQYAEHILIGAGVPDASGRNNAPRNLAYRYVASDTGEVMQPGRGIMWLQARARGARIEKRLVGLPGINAYDVTNDFVWDSPDEEAITNLMLYDVESYPLMTDPLTWPKEFREAFMAGHPGYTFPGVTEFKPWIPGTVNPF